MRVGLLAPPVVRVPPRRYGGTERVVGALADALVDRGHDPVLFASADSETRATLVPTVERPIWEDDRYTDATPFLMAAVARAYAHASELDVMHNHLEQWAYPTARLASIPTLSTVHSRTDRAELAALYRELPEQALVSISDAQRTFLPGANWVGTVYHGLPSDLYRQATPSGRSLAFCGRVSAEKGVHRAIEIAVAAGVPLRIAARVPRHDADDPEIRRDRAYYEALIQPWLDHPLIEFIGEVTDREKQELYGDASALLFPIDWPEPFGLVLIEALACGTPVLATPCGSVPEVIAHGRTGFHCRTDEDFLWAIERLDEIDRAECRREFERRFSAKVMATGYEALYERTVPGARPELVEEAAADGVAALD